MAKTEKQLEQKRQYGKLWRAKNAAYQKHRSRAWQLQARAEAFEIYGKICACCGEGRWEFLSIDHADGSGNEHRRKLSGKNAGGGGRIHQVLKAAGWPSGFRTLCYNCNLSLGFNGYCPHGNGLKIEVANGTERDTNLSLFDAI